MSVDSISSAGAVGVDVYPDGRQFGTRLRALVLPIAEQVGREAGQRFGAPIGANVSDAVRDGVQSGGRKGAASGIRAGEQIGTAVGRTVRERIREAMANLPDAEIDGDSTPLMRKLAVIRAQMKELSTSVDLDPTEAEVKLQSLRTQLSAAARDIQKLRAEGRQGVDIDADALRAMAVVTDLKRQIGIMRREAERPVKVEVEAGAFAREIQGKIRAALAALPKIEIDANSTPAQREIARVRAELAALGNKRIGIDIDADTARRTAMKLFDDLKRLMPRGGLMGMLGIGGGGGRGGGGGGGGGLNVGQMFDVSAAMKALQGLGQMGMEVGQQLSQALAKGLGSVSSSLGQLASAGIPGLIAALVALVAIIIVIELALSLLSAVVITLIGVLGMLAAVATVAVAGFAAMIIAFQGVFQAAGAIHDFHKDAAKNAREHADQLYALAQAEQGLENAQRSAAQGRSRAAQQVASSEQSLANAQRSQLRAQESLTKARVDALRALQDLDQQLKQNRLDEKQSQVDLERAAANLMAAKQGLAPQDASGPSNQVTGGVRPDFVAPTIANPRAIEEAQNAYDQAALRVENLRIAQGRLAEDKAKADKKGVEGSDQVVAAQDALLGAIQSVASAEQALTNARIDQSNQAIASIQAVEAAHHQLAKAEEEMSLGTPTERKLADALNGLSGPAKTFAYFLDSIRPFWDEIVGKAQENLLPVLQQVLTDLTPLFPVIAENVGLFAKAIGEMFKVIGDALKEPFWKDFFDELAGSAGPVFHDLGVIIMALAQAFAELIKAFLPSAKEMVHGIGDWAKGFAEFMGEFVKSKEFKDFIDYVRRNAPVLAKLIIDILEVLLKLMVGLSPLGEVLLKVIGFFVDKMSELSPTELVSLFFGILGPINELIKIAPDLLNLTLAILKFAVDNNPALRVLWKEILKPFLDFLKDNLPWIADTVERLWRDTIKPAMREIGAAISDMWVAVEPILKRLGDLIEFGLTSQVRTGVAVIGGIWDGLRAFFSDPVDFLVNTVINKGIIGSFNAIKAALHIPGDPLAPIDWTPQKKEGPGGRHFATGGFVDGPGGPTDDAIHAMLSAGEYVIPARVVNSLGPSFFDDLIGGASRPKFAAGGHVGARAGGPDWWDWIKDKATGAGATALDWGGKALDKAGDMLTGVWGRLGLPNPLDGVGAMIGQIPGTSVMTDVAKGSGKTLLSGAYEAMKSMVFGSEQSESVTDAVMGMFEAVKAGIGQPSYPAIINLARQSGVPFQVSSTFRQGDPGYHGKGNAVDMYDSAANMQRLAAYMMRFAPYELELIHSGGGGYFVKDGRKVGAGYYGAQTVAGHYDHVHAAMTNTAVQAAMASLTGGSRGVAGPVVGGGKSLAEWIAKAIGITGVGPSWTGPLNTLIQRESGGNPRAINLTDSNAKNGDPSRGLMQTIGSTFNHYRDPRLPNDIYDPVSNIVAGVNYILSRYGSIFNVQQANPNLPPKGYDSGGWLMPGLTWTFNGTGKPEAILTNEQWQALTNSRQPAPSGGNTHYVNNIYPQRADFTLGDLQAVQARQEALSRVGRPR